MFIPIIPHTTVINKTIVYSDTVLSLKDLGSNLQVTSIDGIKSYELESCLEAIFKGNPNTTFNTIQYSLENKKVYFYTDRTISTTKWYESKRKQFKPLTSVEEILEEIKRIYEFKEKEQPEDTMIPVTYDDSISLYDILKLLKRKRNQMEKDEHYYEDYFDHVIHEDFGTSSSFIVYGFDYETDELRVGFKKWDDYDEIRFKKSETDFYISQSESYYAKQILASLGNTLSNLYDKLYVYKEFKNERQDSVNPVNSNVLVGISYYGIRVYIPNSNNRYTNDFELEGFSYTEDFKYDCNSHTVISAIKDNENALLKNILIDISDCPTWMQEELKQIRQEQLKKKEPIQVKLKEKPLTLGKRILNWFNK